MHSVTFSGIDAVAYRLKMFANVQPETYYFELLLVLRSWLRPWWYTLSFYCSWIDRGFFHWSTSWVHSTIHFFFFLADSGCSIKEPAMNQKEIYFHLFLFIPFLFNLFSICFDPRTESLRSRRSKHRSGDGRLREKEWNEERERVRKKKKKEMN